MVIDNYVSFKINAQLVIKCIHRSTADIKAWFIHIYCLVYTRLPYMLMIDFFESNPICNVEKLAIMFCFAHEASAVQKSLP